MSGQNKIQQTYNFNAKWEESYCFVDIKGKCVCLLCGSSVAVPKKHNVERHFQTNPLMPTIYLNLNWEKIK
jgi:hypothetical protein